jgi:hypothetical protein
VVGAATTGFYTVWFGTDHFPLDFKGTGGGVRHYESVEDIHAEESNARVWGGMHWRHSTEVGTRIGTQVGHYTATHLLKERDTSRKRGHHRDNCTLLGNRTAVGSY